MKIGYEHAIKALVDRHKQLISEKADPFILESVAEGIEFLCYPYREDLTEVVEVPLHHKDDFERDEDQEISRKVPIIARLSQVAWDALEYLRGQGGDC